MDEQTWWGADRERPFEVEHDGHRFRLWPDRPRPTVAGQAITTNARWVIVPPDGKQRAGWEAQADETDDDVRRRLVEWWAGMKEQEEGPTRGGSVTR